MSNDLKERLNEIDIANEKTSEVTNKLNDV